MLTPYIFNILNNKKSMSQKLN